MASSAERVPDAVRRWNDTATDYPRDAAIPHLFTEQARQHPDRCALDWRSGHCTYRQLHHRVRRAAAHLRSQGMQDGDTVVVLLHRSAEAVVAVLGVLEAGGAYLPLDPGDPDDRLETVLTDAGIRYVITDRGAVPRPVRRHCTPVFTDALAAHPAPREEEEWGGGRSATDPAYVIYTSGSTGTPKGVVCPHRGPVRLVKNTNFVQLGPEDRLLATTALTFDVSCWEMFGPLLNGACLVLPEPEALLTADALEEVLREQRISVMWLSAGLFHQHAEANPGMFTTLRALVAGGDALNPSAVRSVLHRSGPDLMVNGYGPTEACTLVTAHRIENLPAHAESVPIGRPIANATAYVVRDDGQLAVPGEDGELWVGGDGLALGYLGDPERTSEDFVPDRFGPDTDARLYRTGDTARWRHNGILEYRGRRDRQVKLRGYRVELDEVELILAGHAEVRQVAVGVLGDGPGQRLTAAAVPTPDGQTEGLPGRLTAYARDRLPAYMVPAQIAVVEEMPLKSSGKIDRDRFLDLVPRQGGQGADSGAAPRSDAEQLVAKVWEELLGLDKVRREDDFFALGGTSLHAAQVVSAVRDRLGLHASAHHTLIRHLLEGPSLPDFAARAEALRDGGGDEEPIDFAAETRLDDRLCFSSPPAGNSTAPRTVLLTGGTGFLGVHLIDQLIKAGIEQVHCLTRADDRDAAHARIAARMRHYGLDPSCCEERIVPVPGSLDASRLGLSDACWNELAHAADLIVHAGARVNLAYPYHALAPTNVGGTRAVLDLAGTCRRKPVHYISTVSVLAASNSTDGDRAYENTPLPAPEKIAQGYPQTKWVSERLLAQAAERGLPTAIHRPYDITGTRERGVWNTRTMMCALFRTIAETGAAPDIPLPLNFVPVDYAAQAIVHILTHEEPDGRTYHLANSRPNVLPLLAERLRAQGYLVESVPYATWAERLSGLITRYPDHPMAPYLPLYTEAAQEPDRTAVARHINGHIPHLDCRGAQASLHGAGAGCPPVDSAMIDLYLRYFVDSGFMAPPTETPRRL
ncbi:amino acid adenylation domain-containing protein [Streptomyces chrestomyceticus]|uniref:amino acid adenylation domain-containing protein n=1 Tax=Streptomyces chrestomyceticus TaxID=68185 RepID=UPI0036834F6A